METLILQIKLLLLLSVANGAPVIAAKLLSQRFNTPLDFNRKLGSGRPLLGPSKTIRGLLSALLLTTLVGGFLGFSLTMSFNFALFAMLGDILSSFTKRRLNMNSSSMALGIDQIPESLFPLLACKQVLNLNYQQIFFLVVAFFICELILSRILFRLHIRKHPY